MIKKFENNKCPNCGSYTENKDIIRCKTCNFVPETKKDKWKPANLGKQRGKPKSNIK